MRRFGRMTAALLSTTGAVLVVGFGGAGAAGIAQAAPVVSGVAPLPGVTSVSPQACIIGLNCGCIRGRTCPGDRRKHAVRPPEARLDGVPAIASDQEGTPGFTPAPVLASP